MRVATGNVEGIRVAVDVVVFTIRDGALRVLLVKRVSPPFEGRLALPGGWVETGESLEDAARRQLREKTGVADVYLEQLYSFGEAERDPRGRVITVAYYALVKSTDAVEANWYPLDDPPRLAFDHREIVDYAQERLRSKLEYTTVGFQLLPKKFTLSELQSVYEAILAKKLDKRNFRRKVSQLGIVKPLREWRRTGRKPAELFSFVTRGVGRTKDKGGPLAF